MYSLILMINRGSIVGWRDILGSTCWWLLVKLVFGIWAGNIWRKTFIAQLKPPAFLLYL